MQLLGLLLHTAASLTPVHREVTSATILELVITHSSCFGIILAEAVPQTARSKMTAAAFIACMRNIFVTSMHVNSNIETGNTESW